MVYWNEPITPKKRVNDFISSDLGVSFASGVLQSR